MTTTLWWLSFRRFQQFDRLRIHPHGYMGQCLLTVEVTNCLDEVVTLIPFCSWISHDVQVICQPCLYLFRGLGNSYFHSLECTRHPSLWPSNASIIKDGTRGGTRTHKSQILSLVPMPFGYTGIILITDSAADCVLSRSLAPHTRLLFQHRSSLYLFLPFGS